GAQPGVILGALARVSSQETFTAFFLATVPTPRDRHFSPPRQEHVDSTALHTGIRCTCCFGSSCRRLGSRNNRGVLATHGSRAAVLVPSLSLSSIEIAYSSINTRNCPVFQ
ncbi:unnamed protein product, partial [Ectocarpus sp. 13 AM-2016]